MVRYFYSFNYGGINMEDENEIKKEKKLEIVKGDGSNLDISPVYEHLQNAKPQPADDRPTNIIIPKEHKKSKDDKESHDEDKQDN